MNEELATRLRDKIREVLQRDFGGNHGAQIAFAKAIETPEETLSAFLGNSRPGTGRGKRKGDSRTLLQKFYEYAKERGDEELIRLLIACHLNDPEYLS